MRTTPRWRSLGYALLLAASTGCTASRAEEGSQLLFDRVEVVVGVTTSAILPPTWTSTDGSTSLWPEGRGLRVAWSW